MSEELQGVNAQEVAAPVTQELIEQVNQSENTQEVAVPVEQKPVQDPQINAHYADIRRKAEQEARDNLIKEMYGDQGITTYEQYQQAVERQKAEQQRQQMQADGIDPDKFNQYLENHPDIQFARELRSKQQAEAKFQADAQEFFQTFPDVDPNTISPEVWQLQEQKGISLVDAYMRVNWGKQKVAGEQEAVKKLIDNAQSSPGALSQGGEPPKTSVKDMSKTDFEDMITRVKRGEKVIL